jgi:hypothetical protein
VLPVAGDVTDAVPVDDISNLVTDTVGNTLNLRATPRAIAIIITEAQSQVAPLTQKICMFISYCFRVAFHQHNVHSSIRHCSELFIR